MGKSAPMKLDLYQEIALLRDFPEENLVAGDVATLVDYVPYPDGQEQGAVLEIFNAVGDSMAMAVVPVSAIAPLRADQMPSVRSLSLAV